MKVIVREIYGTPDVLKLKEIEKPIPKDNEVLVKVHAVAIAKGEVYLLKGVPRFYRLVEYGFPKPKLKILGGDISGTIEAVGKDVTKFKAGDEVFGDLTYGNWGGLAEYVCTSENSLALKPSNVSFEEASTAGVSAVTALQGLRKGKIQSGQKVIINGASGGVGHFAVQIAKSFDTEVTATCSTGKMDMVKSIGADHVIDYTKEDFTKNGQHYDLILAANGYHPLSDYKRSLTPKGNYVVTGGSGGQIAQAIFLGPFFSFFSSKKMCISSTKQNQDDLNFMSKLLEEGKVKPVIDKTYPLTETVEAFKYVEKGHAKGKVVITIS